MTISKSGNYIKVNDQIMGVNKEIFDTLNTFMSMTKANFEDDIYIRLEPSTVVEEDIMEMLTQLKMAKKEESPVGNEVFIPTPLFALYGQNLCDLAESMLKAA